MFTVAAKGALQGRFGNPANGYLISTPGATTHAADTLGAINDPASPLAAGVATLNCPGGFLTDGALTGGATAVIQYTSGNWLVGLGQTPGGRNRVDVNMFIADDSASPGLGLCTGDLYVILSNAMMFR